MEEQLYIDCTNLAKLRMMQTILRDVLAMRPEEKRAQTQIGMALAGWIEEFHGRIPRLTE